MALEIEAVYENGVLRLPRELPLTNGATVRVTIHPPRKPGVVKHLRVPWTGSQEQLARHRQAIDELALVGVRILAVTGPNVSMAADFTSQHGLLSSDALVVAVMQRHGLTQLASHDADFDRVPGITRYSPV